MKRLIVSPVRNFPLRLTNFSGVLVVTVQNDIKRFKLSEKHKETVDLHYFVK